MTLSKKQAILKTLLYSDIFDYPLTAEELWRYLSGIGKISKKAIFVELASLPEIIQRKDGFFFIKGKEKTIKNRLLNEKISDKKLGIAKRIGAYLSFIPTIQFIGVSGSVAMRSSKRNDDIDLFIIARKNTLWLTRLLVLFFLELLGKRRGRRSGAISDLICVNMLMDEKDLRFYSSRQNLYTAHEIVRMVPVFERGGVYAKFLDENSWVREYLPNAGERRTTQNITRNYAEVSVIQRMVPLFSTLEPFAKWIQLWYMRNHKTTEEITDTLLAFHPLDYQPRVLRAHKERLETFQL